MYNHHTHISSLLYSGVWKYGYYIVEVTSKQKGLGRNKIGSLYHDHQESVKKTTDLFIHCQLQHAMVTSHKLYDSLHVDYNCKQIASTLIPAVCNRLFPNKGVIRLTFPLPGVSSSVLLHEGCGG